MSRHSTSRGGWRNSLAPSKIGKDTDRGVDEIPENKVIEDICEKAGGANSVFLLLDYDGTLVPIAPTPAEARPDPPLLTLLEKLAGISKFRIAIVSGRSSRELCELIPISGIYLVGGHGSDIVTPDRKVLSLIREADIPYITRKIQELEKLALNVTSCKQGFLFENKGVSFTIHYRLADPEEARRVIGEFVAKAEKIIAGKAKAGTTLAGEAQSTHIGENRPSADDIRFELLKGKKLIEVRPVGVDKGRAIKKLLDILNGEPSRLHRLPIYIGDDITDEDAFRMLKKEGISILISEKPRPTYANYRLKSPESVHRLLVALGQHND